MAWPAGPANRLAQVMAHEMADAASGRSRSQSMIFPFGLPHGKLRRTMSVNGSPLSEPHVEGIETHMATQKHLVTSGVALLGAAAIVAATPALAPNLNPSTTAMSSATYQLAAFADVLRITPNDLVNTYYQGWGGAVGSPSDTANVDPMASTCAGGCYVNGLSGVAYLIEDALINGNGLGPAYVQGGPGIPPWNVSAVNYFYESAPAYGVSGGIQYLVQTGVAQDNPVLAALITLAFGGPTIVSVAFTSVLALAATAISTVPIVGPIIAGGINSYLYGYPPDSPVVQQGIPGLIAYVSNLLTGGIPLVTTPSTAAATAPAPAAATRTAAETVVAPVVSAASTAVSSVTRGLGARTAATVAAPEAASAPAPAAVAPVTGAASPAPAGAEQSDAPNVNAQQESPADVSPVAPEVKSAPAPRSASRGSAPVNRPVRDAVEKVAKQVGSALSGLSVG